MQLSNRLYTKKQKHRQLKREGLHLLSACACTPAYLVTMLINHQNHSNHLFSYIV
ncbi:hypothetical protein A21D_01793 [Virgibacillus dokdonensis]|uniref:Uncharacterized protein n=1 Tax=Virgibacillus dokdonensis TaxID=302167 RepID=A0A2K9IZI1_9BACI|nr:hypothetical protein A21D_01793 [Virgibacillus dokdonensis]